MDYMHDDCDTIRIGDKLPEMTLSAYEPVKDKTIKIKTGDFHEKGKKKGKWMVFMFYPADFTFICPTELEEMAGLYTEFQKLDAEIFSVSCDTAFVHKAWHDNSPAIKKVKYPMVADPTGILAKLFGVYIHEGDDAGLALRGTFIVDPDGVLKTIEIHDNSVGRSAKETLRKLKAAKFVRDNGGIQVCPAAWEPGDDTLKPGMNLVGKI